MPLPVRQFLIAPRSAAMRPFRTAAQAADIGICQNGFA